MGFTLGEKLRGVVPEGTYVVVFEDYVMTTMSDQTPLLRLRFRIVSPEEYAGQLISDVIKVSPDGIWKACQILLALGLPESTYYDSEEACATDLVRKLEAFGALQVTVKHGKGRDPDRVFTNIVSYAPADVKKGKEKGNGDVPF